LPAAPSAAKFSAQLAIFADKEYSHESTEKGENGKSRMRNGESEWRKERIPQANACPLDPSRPRTLAVDRSTGFGLNSYS